MSPAMGDAFLLGHLTDLHLGPMPLLTPRHWNIKRALGVANWLHKRRHYHSRTAFEQMLAAVHAARPDHIAVTGDLVNVGLPSEHARAMATLQQIGAPAAVSVVPGNHDIYCRLWTDAGVERWQAHAMSDGATAGGYPYLRQRGPVALIGVNSSVPTPPGIAQGEVGSRQLIALEGLLAKASAARLCRVVMIHHPPLVGQAPRQRALRDAALLTELLVRAGVELVIHGHNHRDEWHEIDTRVGRAVVVGVGSASMVRPRHDEPAARAALYAIKANGNGWQVRVTRLGLGADQHSVTTVAQHDIQLDRVPMGIAVS